MAKNCFFSKTLPPPFFYNPDPMAIFSANEIRTFFKTYLKSVLGPWEGIWEAKSQQ